jgi:hypothetical protein
MDQLHALESGTSYAFSEWPNPLVPHVAAGVYTIWRGAQLVYAGMSGRGLNSEQIATHRGAGTRRKGLYSRLASHAAGRRSGDQFCVYVADRLILADLERTDLQAIALGERAFDAIVRAFIRAHLTYRFVEVSDGNAALQLEAAIRRGALQAGEPLLNPLWAASRGAAAAD